MRKLWPEGSPFVLNGEVDKRAHPILGRLGADGVTLDFLILGQISDSMVSPSACEFRFDRLSRKDT